MMDDFGRKAKTQKMIGLAMAPVGQRPAQLPQPMQSFGSMSAASVTRTAPVGQAASQARQARQSHGLTIISIFLPGVCSMAQFSLCS